MPDESIFRRSIWDDDPRYAFDYAGSSASERKTIARLAWINAAKINVAPIAPENLLAISAAINAMPSVETVGQEDVYNFLTAGIQHAGAGIAILICMLAAEKAGEYPPIDRKVLAGLQEHDKAAAEAYIKAAKIIKRKASKSSIRDFSSVYVDKVLPVWRLLRKAHSPQSADNYLAAIGGRNKS
jgi:hypothetical protein